MGTPIMNFETDPPIIEICAHLRKKVFAKKGKISETILF